ncbi:MAG: AMP-binding protein [Solirubrobacterales bacterium]|nr:AMP-binding protein [Solirubrobacterales bacterium]
MSSSTTLKGLLEKSLVENATRTALVFGSQRLTYEDVDRASRAAARELLAAGVKRGDRVALLLANGLEFPVYDLAIARLGAVKVPLNDMLAAGDIGHALRHCDARAAVVDESMAPLAQKATAGGDVPASLLSATPVAELVAATTEMSDDPAPELVGPQECAALFYTGGTTGPPKGVMHSQGGLALNQISTILEAEIGRDERLLLTTPLPHAAGLFTLAGLVRGAMVVITSGFDAEAMLAAVEEHQITWTFAVPTMIYRLLDCEALSRRDHSSLRTVLYGAAPINPDRLAQALELLGPVFIQLYAQTECPNFATTLSKGDHLLAATQPEILLSCGRPVLMAEVTVRDEQGTVLAAGEIGEVCIRAAYTMDGYLGDDEATAGRFFDDWLRTGDIAAFDEAGYLYLKDRRSDMVISGGMNVYTAVVERVVAETPGVAQAAVIGVPDPDWGEAVHAVIVVDSPTVGQAEVLEHCRDRLAKYMRPKSVEVIDAMPLTAYGKMDKKALRKRHWAGSSREIG